jgi:hypothetical protein
MILDGFSDALLFFSMMIETLTEEILQGNRHIQQRSFTVRGR